MTGATSGDAPRLDRMFELTITAFGRDHQLVVSGRA